MSLTFLCVPSYEKGYDFMRECKDNSHRVILLTCESLKDGDCGPDPALILSDGSSAGDWRLPTMSELCTLIDFSRRDPALPSGHTFSGVQPGYYWSATRLDYPSKLAWIVYFESGTTCYEAIKNNAGHIWPVRRPKD